MSQLVADDKYQCGEDCREAQISTAPVTGPPENSILLGRIKFACDIGALDETNSMSRNALDRTDVPH